MRVYIVPKVLSGDGYVPKYFGDGTLASASWSGRDFDEWYVIVSTLSHGDHTTVTSQADAMALPEDLAATLTAGQVTATQAKLEAANIPAGWVTTALTWTQVVRIVLGMVQFNQRFKGLNDGAGIFSGGIQLNSTIGDLPVNVRQRLQNAADSLGLDRSGITLGTTLRVAYKSLSDQMQATPFHIGSMVV